MTSKTNLEIINFINFARCYLKQHEKPTKFRYAVEKMEARATKLHETFAEALSDLSIEHAATDKDGAILTDEKGNFRFTKDGLRKRNKSQKELLEKAVEIEPYLATEQPPEELSEDEQKAAAGFVIPEVARAEEEREYDAKPLAEANA